MTNELIGIRYSPWTEKARWAVDHHRIPYRYTEHRILFGMPSLCFKLGRFDTNITVPAWIDDGAKLTDSFDIAMRADAIGQGGKLFPESKEAEIRRLNELSEQAADAARALVMDRVARDPEAQKEALAGIVPAFARPAMRPMAHVGIAYLSHGFSAGAKSVDQHRHSLESAAREVAARIRGRKGRYLLDDRFTYADILAAVTLQTVLPVDHRFIALEPATRRAWTREELFEEFKDVLEWRDQLYRDHR